MEKNSTKIEKLYTDYKLLLFQIANDILRDEHLAEDAVHCTFLRYIENVNKIKVYDEKATKNLLAIICKNLSIDMYNDLKKVNCSIESEDELVSNGHLIDEIIISEINAKVIFESILELPIIYQAPLLLEKFYDLDRKKISSLLNISEQNVHKRIQRAKEKLRANLERKEVISNARKTK